MLRAKFERGYIYGQRLVKASCYWMEGEFVEAAVRGSYLREFGFDVGTKVIIEVTD